MNPRYRLLAPYPEGAITQLARHLSAQERLEKLFLSQKAFAPAVNVAEKLNLVPHSVARRMNRGLFPIPEAEYLNPSWEALRMVTSVASPRRYLPQVAFGLKRAFDETVVKRQGNFEVQISMPATLLESARNNPRALNVFHAVDAHPKVHNEVLWNAYGRAARFEMLTTTEVELICRELDLADAVLVPSTIVAEGMQRYGVDPAKIVRCPYGVDLGAFSPPEEQPRRSGVEIVYVGQVSYRKGIPDLFQAVRGSGLTLTVIGPAINADLLKDLPEEVSYLGRVPHSEVARVLGRADAFVMPSLEDSFGLVITEALATGLPVITTTGVGAIESVSPEDLTLVPAGDPDTLSTILKSLQPLSSEDRAARASRLRDDAAHVPSWGEYSDGVREELDRRYAMKAGQ